MFEQFGQYINCFFSRKNRIYEIYEKGQEKLTKELNIIKILRNIRNYKIFNH